MKIYNRTDKQSDNIKVTSRVGLLVVVMQATSTSKLNTEKENVYFSQGAESKFVPKMRSAKHSG